MSLKLGELAVRFGCELQGDPEAIVTAVATLSSARSGALSFLANPAYKKQLPGTAATAVVLAPADAAGCPVNALIHGNPYATYARMAALLYPPLRYAAGIAASASIAATARVAASAAVAPGVVIGDGAVIGERCVIGAGCSIGMGVQIGDDCELRSRVTLEPGVRLGQRVLIHAGAVLGADGFGFARDSGQWLKVPQVGGVLVGSDVEIGANTTIDRGAIEDTVIGDGVKIDNQVQIGHNCVIGEHTIICAFCGISGSTRIGKRCMLGGGASFVGHQDICDDVAFTGGLAVVGDISKPGVYSGLIPAEPQREWQRLVGRFKRLDTMAARLRRLEQRLGQDTDND